MTDDDKQIMEEHGITCIPTDIFHYKGFKYERLADAARFAELDAERLRLKGGIA